MGSPLDDITVVEVDNWMAAPSAGAILADLGATVIKVEPLTGDPMRNLSRPAKLDDEERAGYDYQFDVDNRGKQSIAVALDTPDGRNLVQRLVGGANVFMCNLLPARQQKFGLDADTLLALRPGLVHATLTGYGTSGPDAWRPGYDVTAFFGRSGIYDAMREGEEGIIPQARPAQGDHTTGLALVGGILAALRMAERTGEGQAMETSLFETAVWTQASDYAVTAMDKAPVRRRTRSQLFVPTMNRYPCGDGKWVVFNMPEASAWPGFCKVIGREDWLDDKRLQDVRSRFRNMAELIDGIDVALAARTRDEWGKLFDEAGFIWGPVLALHEVATDGQAEAIGLFPPMDHDRIGTYHTVRAPFRFHHADVRPRSPAPETGQHTRIVLHDHGFTDEEIDDLAARGAIGGH